MANKPVKPKVLEARIRVLEDRAVVSQRLPVEIDKIVGDVREIAADLDSLKPLLAQPVTGADEVESLEARIAALEEKAALPQTVIAQVNEIVEEVVEEVSEVKAELRTLRPSLSQAISTADEIEELALRIGALETAVPQTLTTEFEKLLNEVGGIRAELRVLRLEERTAPPTTSAVVNNLVDEVDDLSCGDERLADVLTSPGVAPFLRDATDDVDDLSCGDERLADVLTAPGVAPFIRSGENPAVD